MLITTACQVICISNRRNAKQSEKEKAGYAKEREREREKRERERAAKRSIKLRLLCIFSALSHNLKRADGGKIATKATYFRLNSHKFALRRCFMPQLGPRPALPCPLPFGMPHLADLISRELFRFAFVLVAACQRLVFYFYSQ